MTNSKYLYLVFAVAVLAIFGGVGFWASNKLSDSKDDASKQTDLLKVIDLPPNLADSDLSSTVDESATEAIPSQDQNSINGRKQSFENEPAVLTCDFWENHTYSKVKTDIEGEGAAGTLSLEGRLISLIKNAAWEENKKITKIYLVVSKPTTEPQATFYNYYINSVKEGNTVNTRNGEDLLFNLGVYEGSELNTSADIAENLRHKMIALANQSSAIRLKLTIPIYGGRDVGDEFSFACSVSERG